MRDVFPIQNHLAPLRVSQASQNLDQLILPVARDAGYAKDLAFTDRERHIFQSQIPFVAESGKVFYLENGFPLLYHCPLYHEDDFSAYHFLRQAFLGGMLRLDTAGDFPTSQNRHPVAYRQHDGEFMCDERDDGELISGHRFDGGQEFLRFHWRQRGSWFVHDQHLCPAVKGFQDLHHLLFPPLQVQNLSSLRVPKDDIFDRTVRGDQFAVLMNHPNPQVDGVQRRSEFDPLTRHVDLTLLGLQ